MYGLYYYDSKRFVKVSLYCMSLAQLACHEVSFHFIAGTVLLCRRFLNYYYIFGFHMHHTDKHTNTLPDLSNVSNSPTLYLSLSLSKTKEIARPIVQVVKRHRGVWYIETRCR